MPQTKLVRIVPTGVPEIFAVTEVNTDAKPSHPIALPGDPWWGDNLKPSHPIALPGDPWFPDPIEPPDGEQPPTDPGQNCKWTYTENGWFLVCGPTDKPRPPGR